MVPTSETGHPLIFVNIKNVVEQFCFKLAEISRITGVVIHFFVSPFDSISL